MSGLWNSQYKLVQKSLNRDPSGLLQNLENDSKSRHWWHRLKKPRFCYKNAARAARARLFFNKGFFLLKRENPKTLGFEKKLDFSGFVKGFAGSIATCRNRATFRLRDGNRPTPGKWHLLLGLFLLQVLVFSYVEHVFGMFSSDFGRSLNILLGSVRVGPPITGVRPGRKRTKWSLWTRLFFTVRTH